MNGNLNGEGPSRRWVEADGIHIDVRGLPPPQPMVSILALVMHDDRRRIADRLDERDPVFLYPELAEIGWTSERLDAPDGEVRLLLKRAA